jgi:hypothetical protein
MKLLNNRTKQTTGKLMRANQHKMAGVRQSPFRKKGQITAFDERLAILKCSPCFPYIYPGFSFLALVVTIPSYLYII